MKWFISRRNVKSDVRFFCVSAVFWTAFFLIPWSTGDVALPEQLLFGLSATFLSFFGLKAMGYFEFNGLHMRKSDGILVLFAVPLAAIVGSIFCSQIFDIAVASPFAVTLWGTLLAIAVFAMDYLSSRAVTSKNRKKRVVLELLLSERAMLFEDLVELGLNSSVELLDRNDLRKEFLHGRESEIDLIVISRSVVRKFDADALLIRAHLAGIPIVDLRRISADLTGRIRLADADLWTYLLSATPQTGLRRTYTQLKRVTEPLIAIVLAIFFAPLMIVIALAIKCVTKGPVLYKQTRTGFLGREFLLVKFRTMHIDSEKDGPQWSLPNDRRVTRVGRFLRKTRLDELPQLWNVFRGEMGFFGPRPERPEIYHRLSKQIPLFSMRTIVRPGITGWAQVCAGYAASVAESRKKLEFDLYYIQQMSPRLDIIVLLKTVSVAVKGMLFREDQERNAEVLSAKPFSPTADVITDTAVPRATLNPKLLSDTNVTSEWETERRTTTVAG